MPTSGYNFTAQEITVRFRTPYISETLNQQFRGIVSAGVYEGFNPTIALSPLHILLAVDPSGRSSALAVSDLNASTSVGVHLVGDVDLDLSAYFSKTVAVCIDLSYAFPSDTTGVINVYDLGTETVPATSCVLAKVVVPAAGLIPAANISIDGRSFPYLSRGRDATPLVSVVRNGAPYLTASLSVTPDFWENTALVGMSYIASNAVTAPSGFDLTFRARKTVAGVGSITGRLTQKIGLPIPANRRLRLTGAFRPTVVPSIGNPTLIATITDAAGVAITLVTVPLVSAIVGVWQTFSTTVQLPAVTSTPAVLKELSINCSAVTFTTVGANATVFDVADVDLQLEQNGPATDALPEISGESHHTKIRLYADAFPGAGFANLEWNGSTLTLNASLNPASARTFFVDSNVTISQNLTVTGSTTLGTIFASTLDAPAPVNSGPIAVGGVNATEVVLSRVGKNVRVRDTLLVNTATNPDLAKLHVNGNITLNGQLIHCRPGAAQPTIFQQEDGDGFLFTTVSAGTANLITLETTDAPSVSLPIFAKTDVRSLGQISFDRLSALPLNNDVVIRLVTNDTLSGFDVRATLTNLNEWVIGREDGVTGAGPPAGTLRGTDRVGTLNSNGADLIIRGGASTGSAGGGDLVFQTSPAGGAGTVTNAPVTRLTITDAGVATFTNQISQSGGSVILSTGSFGAIISSTTGNIFVQAALGGNVSVSAGAVGTAQLRTTGSGDATVIAVGTANAVMQTTGGGDCIIHNTNLLAGGVSLFSGGTAPAPANGTLLIGAAGDVKIESTGAGVGILAATNIVMQSSSSSISVISASTVNITADGNVNILTGFPGGILSLDSVVKTVRNAGGVAFDISAVTSKRTSDITVNDGTTTNFPTISLVKGVYEFKAMLFYDSTGANSNFDLIVNPTTGNVLGSVVDHSAVGSGSLLTSIDIFAAAGSKTFTNGQSTNNAFGSHWVEGELEFTSDTVVTCSASNVGIDPAILKKGSFFRFFLIHPT